MICSRCGYCCKHYSVIIVDDPAKGIVEDNLIHHPGTGPCKHLLGDKPGEYSCALHDEPWYIETPCHAFGQIEESFDTPCRIGVHVMRKENG